MNGEAIAAYFSANNRLIAPPLPGMASIEHTLSRFPRHAREKIRISSHLESRLCDLKRKEAHNLSREQFLEDEKETILKKSVSNSLKSVITSSKSLNKQPC